MTIPVGLYVDINKIDRNNPSNETGTLKSLGCTHVWLRHGGMAEQARFANLAAMDLLGIVAAPDVLNASGPEGWKMTDPQHLANIRSQLLDFYKAIAPDIDLPLAFCIGDEPQATQASAYIDYIDVVNRSFPFTAGDLCLVAYRGQIEAYYEHKLILTWNTFGFRPAGAPGGYPDGPIKAWLANCAFCAANGVAHNRPAWAMGQAFAIDGKYRMPTSTELTWQMFSALAVGIKGLFMFCWHDDITTGEQIQSLKQFPLLRSSFQYAATTIAKWGILRTAELTGWDTPQEGVVLASFLGANGENLLMAVAGPYQQFKATLPVNGWKVTDLATGKTTWTLFRKLNVTLDPGDAKLWQVKGLWG